jgi:Tol biopolymer transport system component
MRHSIICAALLLAAVLTSSAPAEEWTTPVPVQTGINTQFDEWTPFLSYDGRSLYFSRGYTDTYNDFCVFQAKRAQPFGDFTSVTEVLSKQYHHILGPWVSPDNLRMYYQEETTWQIKVSQRTSVNNPWPQGTAINLGSLTPVYPTLSANELIMAFDSQDTDGRNIYIATRPDKYSPFANIQPLAELNTAQDDAHPSLSSDGLTIYFSRDNKIFSAIRPTLNDPFGNIKYLPTFDIPGGSSAHPRISGDGTALYFACSISGQPADIYVSYLVPEPATIALLSIGGIFLRRPRR